MFRAPSSPLAARARCSGLQPHPHRARSARARRSTTTWASTPRAAGNPQEALKEFEQALKLDPRQRRAHNAMALLSTSPSSAPTRRSRTTSRRWSLRPQFSEAKMNLGNVYLDQGQLRRGHHALRAGAQRHALPDAVHRRRPTSAGRYYKKGDTEQALEHIKAAVTHQPEVLPRLQEPGPHPREQGQRRRRLQAVRQVTGSRARTWPTRYYRAGRVPGEAGDRRAKKDFADVPERRPMDARR